MTSHYTHGRFLMNEKKLMSFFSGMRIFRRPSRVAPAPVCFPRARHDLPGSKSFRLYAIFADDALPKTLIRRDPRGKRGRRTRHGNHSELTATLRAVGVTPRRVRSNRVTPNGCPISRNSLLAAGCRPFCQTGCSRDIPGRDIPIHFHMMPFSCLFVIGQAAYTGAIHREQHGRTTVGKVRLR